MGLADSDASADSLVKRDSTGGFAAQTVELSGNLVLPATSGSDAGNVVIGGITALQQYGISNVFVGNAGNHSMSGGSNTAVGANSLADNASGSSNTAVGVQALQNATGSRNIGIGYQSGGALVSGNDNLYLANPGSNGDSGMIRIGTPGTHLNTLIAGHAGIGGKLSVDDNIQSLNGDISAPNGDILTVLGHISTTTGSISTITGNISTIAGTVS